MEIYNYIDLSLSLSDPCDSSVSTAGTALVLASAYWLQQPLPLALELFRMLVAGQVPDGLAHSRSQVAGVGVLRHGSSTSSPRI